MYSVNPIVTMTTGNTITNHSDVSMAVNHMSGNRKCIAEQINRIIV